MENIKYKPLINQLEYMNMLAAGVPDDKLEEFEVVESEKIDMDWVGDDGKTLGHALFHDDRTRGFKVLRKHSGMDFTACCRYMQSHWGFWRQHMDRILTYKLEA